MWLLSSPIPYVAAAIVFMAAAALLQLRARGERKHALSDEPVAGPQTTLEPEAIEAEWRRMQRDYETRHRRKLICIIHEANEGLFDSEATDIVEKIMSAGKKVPIDIVLHTLGGSLMASERVADAARAHGLTTAYVPYYAMSGGTEIALATNHIVLGTHANLGPTDVQLDGVAARDFEQLEQEKGIKELEDNSALRAIRARRVKRDVATVCARINSRHKKRLGWWSKKRSCDLALKLTDGRMDHAHRITFKEARDLGINVSNKVPDDIYNLVNQRRQQLKQLNRFIPVLLMRAAQLRQARAAPPAEESSQRFSESRFND